MKKIALVLLLFMGFISYSQTDSTDINLSTTLPTLETEMDSLLFGNGNYEDYLIEFTVSDTLNFETVAIEFSTNSGTILYRHTYSLLELQNEELIDELWEVSMNFGKFENLQGYFVSIVTGDYAGVLNPTIIKHY